jgi:hypothetical protein
MANLFSEFFAAWTMSLFLYFVMLVLVVIYGETAIVYWTVWCVFVAGFAVVNFKAAEASQQNAGSYVFFLLAAAAVLILSFLVSSAHSRVMAHWLTFATFGLVGVPLGIGATRYLKGVWRKPLATEILVGGVAGVVGVFLGLLVIEALSNYALSPFIPLTSIPIFTMFGLEIAPYGSWGPFRFLLFIGVQGTQSTVAAMWDTLLLCPGVIAVTALASRLFRSRRSVDSPG